MSNEFKKIMANTLLLLLLLVMLVVPMGTITMMKIKPKGTVLSNTDIRTQPPESLIIEKQKIKARELLLEDEVAEETTESEDIGEY